MTTAGKSSRASGPDVEGAAPVGPPDLDWALAVRVSGAALRRRATALREARPTVAAREVDWLLRAVGLLDLTTLAGDDTPDRVRRLAAKAAQPIDFGLWSALGRPGPPPRVAAVCVYTSLVPAAVGALSGTAIPVCAVSTGFPAAQIPLPAKLDQISRALDLGAAEIDIAISRSLALRGAWAALLDEVSACREACGPAVMKAILATGDLGTYRQVGIAARLCLVAGADFVKTSTGKEAVNATLPVGVALARAVRDHMARGGRPAGIKPAGGLTSAGHALDWLVLAHEELGAPWLVPGGLRLGASGMLASIEQRLAVLVAGRPASAYAYAPG